MVTALFNFLYPSLKNKRIKHADKLKKIWTDEEKEKHDFPGIMAIASLLSVILWYRNKMGAHTEMTPTKEAARISVLSLIQALREFERLSMHAVGSQYLYEWISERYSESIDDFFSMNNVTRLEEFLEKHPNSIAWNGEILNGKNEFEYVPTKITNATLVFSNLSTDLIQVEYEGTTISLVAPGKRHACIVLLYYKFFLCEYVCIASFGEFSHNFQVFNIASPFVNRSL